MSVVESGSVALRRFIGTTRRAAARPADATAAHAADGPRFAGRRLLLRLALPVTFLAAWYIASIASPQIALVLPGPHLVLIALFNEAASGALALHVLASLERAIGGFALAAAVGISFGLAMSQSRILRYLLSGPVELLRPISSIAWIPLAILWFGLGYQSVIFVIAISCIFIVLVNTLAAALRVNPDLIKAALTLGANRWVLFKKVVVPSALPGMLLGLRIALSGAWGGVLVAEMIATREGLGYMIVRAQASFQAELVIGGMVVIGLVGFLLNALFLWVQRKVVRV